MLQFNSNNILIGVISHLSCYFTFQYTNFLFKTQNPIWLRKWDFWNSIYLELWLLLFVLLGWVLSGHVKFIQHRFLDPFLEILSLSCNWSLKYWWLRHALCLIFITLLHCRLHWTAWHDFNVKLNNIYLSGLQLVRPRGVSHGIRERVLDQEWSPHCGGWCAQVQNWIWGKVWQYPGNKWS